MSKLESLYSHLPTSLQHLGCSIQGWRDVRVRYSSFFYETLAALLASDRLSASEIATYQDEKLRATIAAAYESVPYYRELMLASGLTPRDIKTRADLEKLPILTKESVRTNNPKLVSQTARPKRLILRHTSGTTGKSLAFYSTPESIAFQWAVWWRHRMRFGLQLGDLHANFTGKLVVPPEQQRPPYWRWNWPARQALLNMQHVTAEKIGDIIGFLDRNEFVFYSGYPSIIHSLFVCARERGLKLKSSPRVITTGAETLYDFQRRDIVNFTNATLTDQYGSSEGCGNASHCERFRYHEDFEFGILECVDPEPLPDGRVRGRIVCTGLTNDAFPLIRYELGDTGIWEKPGFRCECGRESRALAAIEGRVEDYVLTPEGHSIMRFDYIFKEADHVQECQVVQSLRGEIVLRIVRRPQYVVADERHLANEIVRWISPSLKVRFEYVNEIERERNGKFRAVKSLLRQPYTQ